MIGRYPNGTLYPDPAYFPHGMAYLAAQLHALGMGFGLYTDRGTATCGGRPGIEGACALNFRVSPFDCIAAAATRKLISLQCMMNFRTRGARRKHLRIVGYRLPQGGLL
jgi:hypothetical protein